MHPLPSTPGNDRLMLQGCTPAQNGLPNCASMGSRRHSVGVDALCPRSTEPAGNRARNGGPNTEGGTGKA